MMTSPLLVVVVPPCAGVMVVCEVTVVVPTQILGVVVGVGVL